MPMRNRALHDALRDFALEAAALLVRATEAGEEIAFSLDEQSGGGGTLYRYRPLTDDFIATRWGDIRALPGFEAAAKALGTGARAYLRRRGEPGADAEPALRAMLERLYEDSTSFAFPEERFERVYAGVERALYSGTVRAILAAPVLGLRFEGVRLELGDDIALADVALLAPAPAPSWLEGDEETKGRGAPTAYLVLERDIASEAALPVGEARVRLANALAALRLLEPSGVALGPLGYARAGEGAWQPFRLEGGGCPHGSELTVASDDGPRLCRLVEALEERRRPGPLGWALDRYRMGLSRPSEVEALSDHLLSLRALLGGGSAAEPATVALRLAALRAEEADRRAVQRRVEAAIALEPFVIEGGVGAARGERYVETVGRHGPGQLVRELEEHLCRLLADALCGELEEDLAGGADERLLRGSDPVEIRARRLGARRRRREEAEEDVPSELAGDGGLEGDMDGEGRPDAPAASPLAAFPGRSAPAGERRETRRPPEARTRSEAAPRRADEAPGERAPLTLAPELDDDPEGYSAPV
jgi:hypothetical protein